MLAEGTAVCMRIFCCATPGPALPTRARATSAREPGLEPHGFLLRTGLDRTLDPALPTGRMCDKATLAWRMGASTREPNGFGR